MTFEEFNKLLERDSAVRMYQDKYGGDYVLNQVGRIYGNQACIDRKKLIEYVRKLHTELSSRGVNPFTLKPYTT